MTDLPSLSGSTHNPLKPRHGDRQELKINGGKMIYHRKGPMQQILEEISLVAPTEYSVLIRGKTGTGKENIAHHIHNLHEAHKREKNPGHKDGPFVPINCGAIPKELIGSELFGHVKGAFTGADKDRAGKFDAAEGGTIFLDEIDKMPKEQQVNLLRVLSGRSFFRVGGNTPIPINVRVIAATNRLVRKNERGEKEQTLLPDLYYRLTDYQVQLPALRDRPEDIPLLAEYFIEKTAMELHFDKSPTLTEESLSALKAYPWRGNVRELENAIKGATLRAGNGGEITPVKLKLSEDKRKQAFKNNPALNVGKILARTGSKNQIAGAVGMSRGTLNSFIDGTLSLGTFEQLLLHMYKEEGIGGATELFKSVMNRLISESESQQRS
ncbi:MAG: sigma-54-dependent Fis family transcriptional regulator [Pseudomonadota bacterium]|nr:sigma-54-dependent Fis family transcriptional regulator [Pseudomonadota bacterium]